MAKMILSIGGSAERMLGLPKFLLPANASQSLIQMHLSGGFEAGIEEAILICRHDHELILRQHLKGYGERVRFIILTKQTHTMCETLLNFVNSDHFLEDETYILPLADTAFTGIEMKDVYSNLISSQTPNALSLFRIRIDQIGKLGQVDFAPLSKKIIQIVDKDPKCIYPNLWGICSLKGDLLQDVHENEAHIGISVARWLGEGELFTAIPHNGKYFDCGTFAEYKKFLLE